MVQRGLNYAIIDEADSILVDEARTPLIISGKAESHKILYHHSDSFVKSLKPDDFVVDSETKTVTLTHSGVSKANHYFGVTDIFAAENFVLTHYIDMGLKANYGMKLDEDYVVSNNEIKIVDQFTGRIMDGRRYSDGLHQAIEAKENVDIMDANKTESSITYQNFFRMYNKLAGMTGTAKTEEKEFYEIYHMQVVQIPTNRPMIRKDLPDELYVSKRSKFKAVAKLISDVHKTGRPILVGTVTVSSSEYLDRILNSMNIAHTVLNAKNNEFEAEIVKHAGEIGAITIATNMAGRGTDIKLGPGVREKGGLFVIGTEKHESRRIDNQLRGRSGRQGDPGTSKFFISLEDDLIERFGSENVEKYRQRIAKTDGNENRIRSRIMLRAVKTAQKHVEGNNYDERKNTLRYDDVIRLQRNVIYSQRAKVLNGQVKLDEYLKAMFARTIEYSVNYCFSNSKKPNLQGIRSLFTGVFGISEIDHIKIDRNSIKETLAKFSISEFDNKKAALQTNEQLSEFERVIMLKAVDANWKQHIDYMEQLRMSITLRGYGQHNPLVEYQNTAYVMFNQMIANIERDITRYFMRAEIQRGE